MSRPQSLKHETSAGAVIYSYIEGQRVYLLLYRDYWNYPKGKKDAGENDMQAAQREISEETGLTSLFFYPRWRFSNVTNFKELHQAKPQLIRKRFVYFLAYSTNTAIQLSAEHRGFAWLPFKEAIRLVAPKESRQLLQAANTFLEKNDRFLNQLQRQQQALPTGGRLRRLRSQRPSNGVK